jgi:hypothetical protein
VFTQPQPQDGKPWYLAAPARRARAENLERACAGVTLQSACQVGVGMVSGRDDAFMVSDALAATLNPAEQSRVFQFVKARSCSRYLLGATQPMIFADDFTDEQVLREECPALYRHLAERRDALDGRYMAAGRRWWQWATVRNWSLVADSARSLIWLPCIDRSPVARFCRSPPGLRAAGDVLAIVPAPDVAEDDRFLLGWLNSSAVNDWYRIKGSRTGQRFRYTQAYVERLPLRRIDFDVPAEVALHDQICETVSQLEAGSSDVETGQAQIDLLVGRLLAL